MLGNREGRFTKRREYLNDYQKDASGKYVYTGVLYVYTSKKEKSRGRACAELLILCAAAFVAVIACGFMYVPGMIDCAYVLLPYAAGVLTAGSMLWGAINLLAGGDPMERRDYETTVQKIPARTILTMICAAATVLGEAVYLIINGIGVYPAVYTVLFFVLELCTAVFAFAVRMLMSQLEWKKKE